MLRGSQETSMNITPFFSTGAAFALALVALSVPDSRLVGRWQGADRYFGLSYEEGSVQGPAQYVETSLTISADGTVAGRIGGAELSGCTIEANRGWLGRMLHVKTDFIIRGQLVGRVSASSEIGRHRISVPLDFDRDQLHGSVFVIRNALAFPYPFLKLRLVRQ
jgi:hypothetical protein